MALHRHKKHWLFHATMWVCAVCVLLAFGVVSWKLAQENRFLSEEVVRIKTESASMKSELSLCTKKKTGLEKSVEGIVEEKANEVSSCEVLSEFCETKSCLFSSDNLGIAGIAEVKGYFIKHKREAGFEENKMVECSAFVVTEGPKPLVDDFLNLVDQGNTINYKNEKGQLVLTIDPETLPSPEKQKLMKSTENAMATIQIVRVAGFGRSLPACGSVVDLLRAK